VDPLKTSFYAKHFEGRPYSASGGTTETEEWNHSPRPPAKSHNQGRPSTRKEK